MLSYIFGFLLLSKFGIPKPIRYALLVLMAGLVIVGLIYASIVFHALTERNQAPHVQHHSTR